MSKELNKMDNKLPQEILDKMDDRAKSLYPVNMLPETTVQVVEEYEIKMRSDFYRKNLREKFNEGATFGYHLRDAEITELQSQLTPANKRIEELTAALGQIISLAEDGASLTLIYNVATEAVKK